MKTNSKIFKFFLVIILMLNVFLLGGCWDSRELNELFLVEGTSIDITENDEYELTFQIANTSPTTSDSNQKVGTVNPLIISAQNKSVFDAYITINENCSKGLLFDHNQVLIFCYKVAQDGIEDLLDVFIRVQEARIETPVVIVENEKGATILNAKIEENKMSAQFVTKIFNGLTLVSKHYQTRIIDIILNLLSESHSATVPMIKLINKEGKDVIEFAGFAVLKCGKMVGKLSREEVRGFVLAKGGSANVIFHSETQDGLAGFKVQSAEGKIDVKTKENNEIEVNVNVKGNLELSELVGFTDLKPNQVVEKIKELGRAKAKSLVEKSIAISQNLNADIFGIANLIWRSNPKAWRKIQASWDEIYPNIKFNVKVEFEVAGLGDVFSSLSIEKENHEKEYNISGN